MIAFITFNSSLVLSIEGLCSSNPWEFEFRVINRIRTHKTWLILKCDNSLIRAAWLVLIRDVSASFMWCLISLPRSLPGVHGKCFAAARPASICCRTPYEGYMKSKQNRQHPAGTHTPAFGSCVFHIRHQGLGLRWSRAQAWHILIVGNHLSPGGLFPCMFQFGEAGGRGKTFKRTTPSE